MSTGTVKQPIRPVFCGQCGKQLQSNVKFCTGCGTQAGLSTTGASIATSGGMHQSQIETLERTVADHPDDESYRKLLAVALHDDAMKGWWEAPEDHSLLCVSYEGLIHARKRLYRAWELPFNDPVLRKAIEDRLRLVNSLEQRNFAGSWLMVVVLSFFLFFPGIIWWYVNRRPVYLINHDYMAHSKTGKHSGAAARMGGLQGGVYDFFSGLSEDWGWLFGLFFMLTIGVVLSPIFMFIAYKQNYLDAQKVQA